MLTTLNEPVEITG